MWHVLLFDHSDEEHDNVESTSNVFSEGGGGYLNRPGQACEASGQAELICQKHSAEMAEHLTLAPSEVLPGVSMLCRVRILVIT